MMVFSSGSPEPMACGETMWVKPALSHAFSQRRSVLSQPMCRIRSQSDPELFAGSGSAIITSDPERIRNKFFTFN